MKLWRYIKEKMEEYPEQRICEEEREISYKEMIRQAEELSEALSDISCCAVLCRSEMMEAKALLACFAAGATATPLSGRYGEVHCRRIMEALCPEALITDQGENFVIQRFPDPQDREQGAYPALILYTSGTGGRPKGSMLTEDNILTNVGDIEAYFKPTEKDRILITRPLYHCAVLTGEFLTGLIKGMQIRFYTGRFDPPAITARIRRFRITVFGGTPTLLSLMSRYIKNGSDLPLRHICITGECMSRGTGLRIADTFPQAEIYHGYGLTEAGPRVSCLPPALFRQYPDCVGMPLRSVQVKVVRKDGTPARVGEEGLLYVKGGNVMLGYYREPKRTEAVLSDGWLCTGDIGLIRPQGILEIKGRGDDLIIRGGMNIYPQEIEGILKEDPRVKEALVYGYAGAVTTQIGLKIAGDFSSVEEVRKLCSRTLPLYQRPMRIELLPELEKNGSGKIKRGGSYGFRSA